MIFVTVGMQLGFDRLIRAMDEWAERMPDETVFAQIGDGEYIPKHMDCARRLGGIDFADCANRSDLIVAHAGIGSLVTALEACKPIIVLPRLADLKEHRNNHQYEGATSFFGELGAFVALDKFDLFELLGRRRKLLPAASHRPDTSVNLNRAINNFIHDNGCRTRRRKPWTSRLFFGGLAR